MSSERRGSLDKKKQRLGALLHLAKEDAQAAALLATHGNHYAAYHCQQAAEKLIRAWLIHHEVEPGLSHHLDTLVAQLPEDEGWKARLAPLHRYTPYATTYRYATPGGRVPTAPEATEVARDAEHIASLIDEARTLLVGD
jgi:HEPN domain-containing protein